MSKVTSVETYWMTLFLFWVKLVAHLPLTVSMVVVPPVSEYVGLVHTATTNDTPHYAFSFSCSLLE